MEAAYSQLITWSASAASAAPSSQWGDNILVVGDPKRQSGSKVKSLIADSFGFTSNGELDNVSGYLKSHGGFELEMVGSSFITFGGFILTVLCSEYNVFRIFGGFILTVFCSECAENVFIICSFHFKVESNGNCLFSAIKKSIQIRHSGVVGSRGGDRDLPYYPTRYFHCQVVNWMVENRQKVFVYMDSALRATYGVADSKALHGGPLSYRDYLHNLLRRDFWGDKIVLWAVSMMRGLKVTVLNSKTLQEYRIRHNSAFKHVDVGLVYNSYSHYSAAGRSIRFSSVWLFVLVDFGRLLYIVVKNAGRLPGHNAGRDIPVDCGRWWSLAIYRSLKCWSLAS